MGKTGLIRGVLGESEGVYEDNLLKISRLTRYMGKLCLFLGFQDEMYQLPPALHVQLPVQIINVILYRVDYPCRWNNLPIILQPSSNFMSINMSV